MNLDEDAVLITALSKYQIDYILLSRDVPMLAVLAAGSPCCIELYENDEVVLFQVQLTPDENAPLP
jgi:hypothetical protein